MYNLELNLKLMNSHFYIHVYIHKTHTLTLNIFVHIFDDTGQSGHVLLGEGHAQIVADEIVPGLQHRCGDEIQNARGQT